MKFRCPNCQNAVEIANEPVALDETISEITCPSCESQFSYSGDETETVGSHVNLRIGHFEAREVIGEGAFGTVYRAWDSRLERFVAIKLPRQGRITPETSRLFLKEAKAAAGIKHPNVVQVHEVGEHEGSLYIVTELIDGVSLNRWIQDRPLTAKEAAQLMIPICEAVQAAHDAGIVHRDLKPGNVLLDTNNVPYVTDFGLASRRTSTDITVTQDGKIVGTPAYMSPEQARGESAAITALTDVYSLGVIFYRLLTGRRPFEATDSRTMLFQILTDDPPAPRKLNPTLDKDVQTICLKAMEKVSSRRYLSAAELAADLRRFRNGQPIQARPISLTERSYRWIQKNRTVSALIACIIVLLGCLLLIPPTQADDRLAVQATVTAGPDVAADTNVRWAIVPMDARRWVPIPEGCRRIDQPLSDPLNIRLTPGDYLVIADIEGFGFHEVYRRVPDEAIDDSSAAEFHQSWTVVDGTIRWPAIQVLKEADVVKGMVAVPGGTFLAGDDTQSRPRHERKIAGLWVSPTEVSIAEYRSSLEAVNATDAIPTGYDQPANVSFTKALQYAEACGQRLPTEFEFEYLATDLGTSETPSGDPADYQTEFWSYGPCGQPAFDVLPDYALSGLHSNVAEWTDSQAFPYPGKKDLGPASDAFRKLKSTRVVKGGPLSLGQNDRTKNRGGVLTRRRDALDMGQIDSEVGFRCVRSTQPRFVDRAVD